MVNLLEGKEALKKSIELVETEKGMKSLMKKLNGI